MTGSVVVGASHADLNDLTVMSVLIDMDAMMSPDTIAIAMIKSITGEIETIAKIEISHVNKEETTSAKDANIVAGRTTEGMTIVTTTAIRTEQMIAITVEETIVVMTAVMNVEVMIDVEMIDAEMTDAIIAMSVRVIGIILTKRNALRN